MTMTRDELRLRWSARRAEWHQVRAFVDGASVCEQVLADLEYLWHGEDEAELTLEEASNLSGYSEDHLRRLVRENRLPSLRRGRRLFFRAGDLPRKSNRIDRHGTEAYDPIADARQVAARRNPGAMHGTQAAA
jgi:excisionase family DNA binding protein